VKEAYWKWFDSRILQKISEEDPAGFAWLVTRAAALVEQAVREAPDLEDDNGSP
jgi:hypothetical protein